jgi:hypothetical protein
VKRLSGIRAEREMDADLPAGASLNFPARRRARRHRARASQDRAFAEAGSSSEAHRAFSPVTERVRRYRRNKRLGLRVRPVRPSEKQAQKLVELGYLSLSKGSLSTSLAAPPNEKATAREDQARQASADGGAGNCG